MLSKSQTPRVGILPSRSLHSGNSRPDVSLGSQACCSTCYKKCNLDDLCKHRPTCAEPQQLHGGGKLDEATFLQRLVTSLTQCCVAQAGACARACVCCTLAGKSCGAWRVMRQGTGYARGWGGGGSRLVAASWQASIQCTENNRNMCKLNLKQYFLPVCSRQGGNSL